MKPATLFGSVLLCALLVWGGMLAAGQCEPGWIDEELIPGANSTVSDMVVFDDGSGPALYAGGAFTSIGGAQASRIAKWTGTNWSEVGGGVDGSVRVLYVFDDGTGPALYVGGQFENAGGVPVHHIARWDGDSWSELAGGTSGSITGDVNSMQAYDDGSGLALYVGGVFDTAGEVTVNGIAKWDGESWSDLDGGLAGGLKSGDAMAVFDDGSGGKLYVGGMFTYAGGNVVNYIAAWDGVEWTSLGSGVNGGVFKYISGLTVHNDGTGAALYASGRFTLAGGNAALNIAKWDGNEWSPLGAGLDDRGKAFATYADGTGTSLYVGGAFTMAGEQEANLVARWDGANWHALGVGVSGAGAPNVQFFHERDFGAGPALIVGGLFSTAGGTPADNVAFYRCEQTNPLGACCFLDGTCEVTTEAECGGTWLGADTSCDPNPCPQPVGACCYVDGLCEELTEDACTGTWLGMDTSCDPNPCPQPMGACCYVDGLCEELSEDDCTGTWLGMETGCDPNPCPQPTGACCFADGLCEELTEAECMGTWLGMETTCDPNPCPQPVGACCYPDGSCAEIVEAECVGFWQGADTVCEPGLCPVAPGCPGDYNCDGERTFADLTYFVAALSGEQSWINFHIDETGQPPSCEWEDVADPNQQGDGTTFEDMPLFVYLMGRPCPEVEGACCIFEVCSIATESECVGSGGVWLGEDIGCDPNPCVVPPIGACCIGQVCELLTEAECAIADGIYQGDDTGCDPNPCVVPVGACCIGAQCSIETASDCVRNGGVYVGDGTTCDPNPCVAPVGACCVGTLCIVETESDCIRDGGVYQGDDTNCDPNPCVPSVGACCIGESCLIETEAGCMALLGVYQGDGTTCDPNPCMVVASCHGDYNCDGERSFDDITFFVAALSGEAAWVNFHINEYGSDPACEWESVNDPDGMGDGTTFDDIQPFIELLGTPCE